MKTPGSLMKAVVFASMTATLSQHAGAQQLPKYEILPLLSDNDNGQTRTALRIDRAANKVKLCRVVTTNPIHYPVLTGGCVDSGLPNLSANVSRSSFAAVPFVASSVDRAMSFWSVNVDTGDVQFCEIDGAAGTRCMALAVSP
jgi:hypothetical protein